LKKKNSLNDNIINAIKLFYSFRGKKVKHASKLLALKDNSLIEKRVDDLKPEEEPLILEDGSRVYDLAKVIHKDFARNFKYARVWRDGSVVKVGKDFMLNDMDIVELHAT
jgi:hypothetical protein